MSEEIHETPSTTPNFQTELAAQLAELMPEVIADGKVDVEKLKGLLDGDAADTSERFGLFWPGKKRALRAAQEPTTATLRPDFENSKDWDTTKNVFIEGDNLEVLKILQKHYHAKIKLIYIDPPYNTGKDFVYPDNYKEGLDTYLEWTRQVNEEGKKLSTNAETEGRFHSNWLNMMYPRLVLARNLLTEDGFIVASIGDDEVTNFSALLNLVFGERNRIAQVAVNRTSEVATERTVQKVEYLLVYARKVDLVQLGAADKVVESRGTVGNVDQTMPVIEFPAGLRCVNIDDGIYKASRQIPGSRENIELISPAVVVAGRLAQPVRMKARWRASNDMRNYFANGCAPTEAKIRGLITDIYIDGDRFMPRIIKESVEKLPTYYGTNKRGSRDLERLGLDGFDYPKSVEFIKWILGFGLKNGGIVLDFFAGSATTAAAAMQLSADDGISRKFIVVQLPEPAPIGSKARRLGLNTLSEVARKRISLERESILAQMEGQLRSESAKMDVGFRAYKLADTNFAKWKLSSDVEANALQQHLLDLRESSSADEATTDGLLTEILLKQGYSLIEQIAPVDLAGLKLRSVGDGIVLAYLNEHVKPTLEQLRAIVDEDPARLIVLEDAFQGDDQLKTNLAQLCKSKGIELWTA